MSNTIAELMRVPPDQHDVTWLQESLQVALELELSTLPPYLCAALSINRSGGGDPSGVYGTIMSVVYEEMLHFGLACNMLAAVGGTPKVLSGYQSDIVYPGSLPGGVLPGLNVYLAGLSKTYLNDVCMAIEYPEGGPIATLALGETYTSIGAFYDAILAAFQTSSPTIQTSGQVAQSMYDTAPADLTVLQNVTDVENAISLIKQEGEGTSQTPDEAAGSSTPAHYYRFAEIWHGATLAQTGATWGYTGAPITFPVVYDMPPVPKGGYVNPSSQVQAALNAFNTSFRSLLQALDSAWSGGGAQSLPPAAMTAMNALPGYAAAILAFPLPGGSGVYGPTFQV
jgi:ferritin-like protein